MSGDHETDELYKIIGYLERQLSFRAHSQESSDLALAAVREENAQLNARVTTLLKEKEALALRYTDATGEIRDMQRISAVAVAKSAISVSSLPPLPSTQGALPQAVYARLYAVEAELDAERRGRGVLAEDVRRLEAELRRKERECVCLSEELERARAPVPALVSMEQRCRVAERRGDELEEENRVLLTVQRAKTRAIQELSAKLESVMEESLVVKDEAGTAWTLQRQLEATEKALQEARAKEALAWQKVEAMEGQSMGVPVELWEGERGALMARVRAAEEETIKNRGLVAKSGRMFKMAMDRWRVLAKRIGQKNVSLRDLRVLVQKQRETLDAQ